MNKINVFLILFLVEIIAEVGLKFSPVIMTGLSLKNVLLYVLVILAIKQARQYENMRFQYTKAVHQFNWAFMAWVAAITLVSLLASLIGPDYSAFEALTFYKTGIVDAYLFFVVFLNFPKDKNQTEFLINGFFIVMVITGLMTMAEVVLPSVSFFGFDDDSMRPRGGLGEPNQTAAVLCLFVLPMISSAIGREKNRIYYIVGIIILLVTIALTGSRGGILGFVVGLGVLMYVLRNDVHIEKKTFILVSSAIGLVLIWFLLPEYYQQLLLERFSVFQTEKIDWDHASAGRTILFQLGVDAWLNSPLFGSGWRGFNALTGNTSHNTYFEVLVNAGPIGVIFYLLIYAKIFKIYNSMSMASNDERFLIKGFVAGLSALLTSLSFVNLYTPWFVVWAFIGLSIAFCYFVKNEKFSDKIINEYIGSDTKNNSMDSKLKSSVSTRMVELKKRN